MTLFPTQPDTLDGFEEFWKKFPRDPRHPGRKSRKEKCKALWRARKLHKCKAKVMAALNEDIKGIKSGSFKKFKDGNPMQLFPGIHPWLNQGLYDRDIPEPKEKKQAKAKPVEPDHKPMTAEEKKRRLPEFRRMAKMPERMEVNHG